MLIPPPKTAPDHADHVLDCEFALEPGFQDLIDRAKAAGWSDDTITLALIGLADAHQHMIKANAESAEEIAAAMEKRQQ